MNIGTLIKKYKLQPYKGWSQSFLVNERVADRIIQAAEIKSTDKVLEIGPGLGILTRRLVKLAGRVLAIEIDTKLYNILKTEFDGYDNLQLLNENILNLKLDKYYYAEQNNTKFKIVANIPYNITSQILEFLIKYRAVISTMILMLQEEVANRIVAQPGSRVYGSLTIMLQYYTTTEKLFTIRGGSFFPVSKVNSAIVKFTIGDTPAVQVKDEQLFFAILKSAFNMRRKMLRNSLKTIGYNTQHLRSVEEAALRADIDLTRRAESLSLQEFAKLTNSFIIEL